MHTKYLPKWQAFKTGIKIVKIISWTNKNLDLYIKAHTSYMLSCLFLFILGFQHLTVQPVRFVYLSHYKDFFYNTSKDMWLLFLSNSYFELQKKKKYWIRQATLILPPKVIRVCNLVTFCKYTISTATEPNEQMMLHK